MLTVEKHFEFFVQRLLAGGDNEGHADDGGDGHSEFGVHVTYETLFRSIVFFAVIYLAGAICSRLLKMPALVGQVFAGMVFGPPVLDYVPNPEAFVMLGEIGLILLVLEAGIDIDVTMLKLIGIRGIIIAIVGSILPIGIGIGVAFAIGTDVKGSIAAGATFGPTSLGIAMNILRTARIINTPVGQLIVAAAVIDDMIALIILSLLRPLTGDITVSGIIVPIVSALGFLIIGGYLAVWVAPGLLDRFIFSKVSEANKGALSLAIMMGLLIALMPATYYAQASFLMGAFIAGLTFCSNHEAHVVFVSQFKRIMQWLMRIFFAASIGFQVPVKHFGNGTVLWQGCLFTVALLGKLATGFLVPNFTQHTRFTSLHLRDCLVTGFSMAAEGEFAFVIAVFAVDSLLITQDLYASVVLAVLLSTIFAPLLLRFTISYYNKQTQKAIEGAQKLELERKMKLKDSSVDLEQLLVEGIKNKTTVFLCIQTQSAAAWGLLPRIMQGMSKLHLEIIDHRSWNPRGVNTTLVNEIFAKDSVRLDTSENADDALEKRLTEVREKIEEVIHQEDAKVKVTRWFPGVVEEIVEETTEEDETKVKKARISVSESLLNEASQTLEKHKERQTNLTREKPLEEIIKETVPLSQPIPEDNALHGPPRTTPPRRRRVKTRSTPVVGGDMFAAPPQETQTADIPSIPGGRDQAAQLIVNGQAYKIRIDATALNRVRNVHELGSDRQVHLGASDIRTPRRQRQSSYDNMLHGFVRKDDSVGSMQTIEE